MILFVICTCMHQSMLNCVAHSATRGSYSLEHIQQSGMASLHGCNGPGLELLRGVYDAAAQYEGHCSARLGAEYSGHMRW